MENRKRKSRTPEEDCLKHISAFRDKSFLDERFIDNFKGRGVFTHKTIEPSTFVVEYRGSIVCHKDTKRKKKYGDTLVNNFSYEFSWNGESWCIDASKEDKSLGRLVNDDNLNPNCEMKKIVFEGRPHLCLFAVKKIFPGEEITYSYGDSSYPWRSRLEDPAAPGRKESSDDDDDDDDDGDDDDDDDDDDDAIHTIPFTCDVQAFYWHLQKTSASAIESLKTYESPQCYRALCRVTLAQVTILNKGSPEVTKMSLMSFQERDDATQVLSKNFVRINMLSKSQETVAVLLTSELVGAITLLVNKRTACGVHKDNPYLFAKPLSLKSFFYGKNCTRTFSNLCLAKNPEHLTSVHLHKHIARVFQILNLENDELVHLAKLLGLDIPTDRDYYRLPKAAVELAKISKLLLAMEKGSLERFKGNSLDEIEIEDLLELEMDLGSGNGSDEEEWEESDVLRKQNDDLELQCKQLTPDQDALEHIKAGRDKPFLQERFIDPVKGRGVFTDEAIEPSAFIVEYRGKSFPHKETQKRKGGDALNNFLFDFSWNGTNWRIDASAEDWTLGRLVNDDHISPNCNMKKVVCEGKPHVCLFALKNISKGEEITFNYGNSSYPWRSPVEDFESSSSADSCCDDENVDDDEPDDEPSSDESFTRNNSQNFKDNLDFAEGDSSKQQRFVSQRSDDSSIQQEDTPEDGSNNLTSDGEPNYPSCTKKNYCYICGKAQSKIARHLLIHRKEEPEIEKVFKLRRNSKERKIQIGLLRNKGNFKHNQEVLKNRCGELKVKRRKLKTPITANTYATCMCCKGMFCRKDIRRHTQNCSLRKTSKAPAGLKTNILTLVATSMTTDPQKLPSDVKGMFKKLKKDEISTLVQNDPCLLQLAQCLCSGPERKKKNTAHIQQRLREMARLLFTLRKESIDTLKVAIKPENFSRVVEAVKELAQFNEETKSCERPTLALNLGNGLRKIGEIAYATALKEDADNETLQEVETFLTLCTEEWASGSLSKSDGKITSTVPFVQDVQRFFQYMENTAESAVQSLTTYESPQVYDALLRVTLTRVSVLNGNSSKVSKITLQSFKEMDQTKPHDGHAGGQPQSEQILCRRHMKMEVTSKCGKRGGEKKVAVTLTPELLSAITLLVSKRETCGVCRTNPFLFAKPVAKLSFYRAHACMGTTLSRCGSKNPEKIRCHFFRKHVARIFNILGLSDGELAQLAKLLGRDFRTDREYYRTPGAAGDIAKITELLSAMENGSLDRFEGKSFKDMEISDQLQPDMEQDKLENSDTSEDDEDAESSPLPSGSSAQNRVSSQRKSGRGRRKESEEEDSELSNNENDEVKNDEGSEDYAAQSSSLNQEDAPNVYCSDTEDMNVDFDMDMDTDEDVQNDRDGDPERLAPVPAVTHVKETTKQDEDTSDGRKKEGGEGGEQPDGMDVDRSSSSEALNTAKKNKLLAEMMKQVKIIIPKLQIENLQGSVHISQLSSECKKSSVKDQPRSHECQTLAPTNTKKEPIEEKEIEMTCSHCKKSMARGQTAYQKKGYADVFCSKSCLFELFPIYKPATKTCHYCHKAIAQPLDLIMAVVDIKGTMKDFCSLTCLCCFKSKLSFQTTRFRCGMCNIYCTTTSELIPRGNIQRFCGDSCSERFRRDNVPICNNCNSACHDRPLLLKLHNDTKIICREGCLQDFKEKTETADLCTMCHRPQMLSEMVDYKSSVGLVELFCTRTCLTSYIRKDLYKLQGSKDPAQLKSTQGIQWKQKPNTEEEIAVISESTVPSKTAEMPTLTIAKSLVVCSKCGEQLLTGKTLYQPKNSLEVFCSASCLSERHPHVNEVAKKCYNCFQEILRPHNVILAPVDDLGTMKELCSNTCLSSVQSKLSKAGMNAPPPLPHAVCRTCSKFSYCRFKLTLDGLIHELCSETCYISYHKLKNVPLSICDICSSNCLDKHMLVKKEDGGKTICSEQCLVKFKGRVRTLHLCPMCKTSHQMSDMVETKNEDGVLDFFCSNRCLMVFKAHSFAVQERTSPSSEESNIEDVKPPLIHLHCIKEEPIKEEYNVLSSMSAEDIKDEPPLVEEDLKIGSVFSLQEDSPAPPSPTTFCRMAPQASCSNCKNVLLDGETVYERKGLSDIFCSTSCLLKHYQMKQVKKTCQFCLEVIRQSQNTIQAPVDTEWTMKDFCSQTCLSSFTFNTLGSTKIPIVPLASHSQCRMCNRYCISKHEIIQDEAVHKICSRPCFLRFCNMNNLCICENCHCRCDTPLILRMEGGNKKLCNEACLVQFKEKIKTLQLCSMCHTSHPVSAMLENKTFEDLLELYCSSSCVMASKIQAVSASGTPLNCDSCGKITLPACHLAMSDASIRNFCTLTCAMAYKEAQNCLNAAPNLIGAPEQSDFPKPPEKLPCAQCGCILKTTPKVVQKEGKMHFLCSLACSQDFKRVNNIMGVCEYCRNERIFTDTKRVDHKDCYFCSDRCMMLFHDKLEKEWGKHCRSCAYCSSISRTVVTQKYGRRDKEFCSEDCSSKYDLLFSCVAKCDNCGRAGKQRQSLPMQGGDKHFCDLGCLLHFCNKKVRIVNTVSSGSSEAADSSSVITHVISLASAVGLQTNASTSTEQHVSFPEIQSKDIGHASVQTVPKELKNKSTLCTPLVHNKGVSCAPTTVETETQTEDIFLPPVTGLPVPVPMYDPLPVNMYSRYTPQPVGLPSTLPVPMFLSKNPNGPEPTMKAIDEGLQPDTPGGNFNAMSDADTERDDGIYREGRLEAKELTKEEGRQTTEAPEAKSCRQDLDEDLSSFNIQEDSFTDNRLGSPNQPHVPAPPPALQMRVEPQCSSSSAPAPPQFRQISGPHQNEVSEVQQLSEAETSQRDFSKVTSKKPHKLKSQCGIDAWKRWIQWRTSQTELNALSYPVGLKKDVLQCSAAELSHGLCLFIKEVGQADGAPYSPDVVFYLCLSMQQYLFENGRMENIFSDWVYNKFSTEFTKSLKLFQPSVTARGSIHSHVEEEFLWNCKQLGAYSPVVLLNTLLFFFCKFFGFTTVEQHRQLSFSRVRRFTKTNPNNTQTTSLQFYPPTSVNEEEPDTDAVPAKKRKKDESKENFREMMENTENPLRCPVRLYEFYLSKCSESTRRRCNLFYLHPEPCCSQGSPLWFSSTPLDEVTMDAMLVRILAVREALGGSLKR